MYYNDIISRKYEIHVLIRTYEKSSRMKEKLHWKTFARENMSSRATAMTFFICTIALAVHPQSLTTI